MTFFRYDNAIKNSVMLLSVNRFVTHIFQPLMNRQRILIGQQGEDLISVRFPSDSITFPVVPFISLSNFSILINRQD